MSIEATTVSEPAREGADPLIDEVREIRRKLSEAAGNDPARLAEIANRVADDYRRRRSAGEQPAGAAVGR